jgi:hypothetical protein
LLTAACSPTAAPTATIFVSFGGVNTTKKNQFQFLLARKTVQNIFKGDITNVHRLLEDELLLFQCVS